MGRSAADGRDRVLRFAAVQLRYTPNALTARGRHWLPREPLWDWPDGSGAGEGAGASRAIEELGFDDALAGLTREAIARADEESQASLGLKLKQVLCFALDAGVDVLVLPEALVPAGLVELLVGFRSRMCVFAGIGYVRDDDVGRFAAAGFAGAEEAAGRNAAVFVDADGLTLVTKRYPAKDEDITPGRGIARVTTRKGGRAYELGLAICMDYIQAGHAFDDGDSPPDAVLVSALTKPVEDFYPTPRNYPTVLANHAGFGGSAILGPDMTGLCFTDRRGTEPLPPGEGIVVADFSGFPTRPSGTFRTANRIVCTAAITYRDEDGADLSTGRIAAELGDWELSQYRDRAYAGYLDRAARFLDDDILGRCVQKLRARQHEAVTIDQPAFALLTTHLVLDGVRSEPELRYAALGALQELWHRSLTDTTYDRLGALFDEVKRRRSALDGRVRLGYRDRVQPARSGREPAAGASAFFRARLVRRAGADPIRSLPHQLTVLRAVALEADETTHLVYRLSTVESTNGGMVPVFDVLGLTETTDQAGFDGLAEGVGDQLAVALGEAWLLAPTVAEADPAGPFVAELRPVHAAPPAITEDWGALVSYLQRLRQAVTVQLTCFRTAAKDAAGEPPAAPRLEGFVGDAERRAAMYLHRAAEEDGAAPANLAVALHVFAAQPVSDPVLRGIGLALFRSTLFEVVRDADRPPQRVPGDSGPVRPGLRPAEVLRMFHPPFDLGQRRGSQPSGRSDLALPASAQLPVHGVALGTAPVTDPPEDSAEIRLATGARLRHMFIVGRTGSGKTNLLKLMARQDIRDGRGVAVIDPHGDLVDHLLGHVGDRQDEVVLLDFGDPDHLPVLNPLDLDVTPTTLVLAIEQFIQLLVRQSSHEFYGPRFEGLMRLALESITNEKYPFESPSVLDVVRILRSPKSRRWIHSVLDDRDLRARWRVFDQQSPVEIAEALHWALSTFSEIEQDGVLGHVLAGGSSTVSIDACVSRGGVLLVKIPEWEVSRSAANLLGAFVQERIRMAVYRRRAVDPFYLYVDEFQAFAGSGFEELVAEARKFGLGLVLANQNLQQLTVFSRFTGNESTRLRDAVMGNVANRVVFSASPRDSRELAPELGVAPDLLQEPGRFQAVAQLLVDGRHHTFTLRVPTADADLGLPDARTAIRDRMISRQAWRRRDEIRRDRAARARRISVANAEFFPVPGVPAAGGSVPVGADGRDGSDGSDKVVDGWELVVDQHAQDTGDDAFEDTGDGDGDDAGSGAIPTPRATADGKSPNDSGLRSE